MTERNEQASEVSQPGAHPAGIWWALKLMGCVALVAVLPYAVLLVSPSLRDWANESLEGQKGKAALAALEATTQTVEDLRPWRPGSEVPFTGLFELTPPTRSALAGVERKRHRGSDDDDELLATAPLPEARGQGQGRVGAGYQSTSKQSKRYEALRVAPEELQGMTRSIEDATDELRHFHRKLVQVAQEEPGAAARVFVYSDSVNGADRVSSALRHKLQARFGDGGKGWVPMAPGWEYQRHQDVAWTQRKRWRTWVVNRGKGPGDRYGYGGVVATNVSPGASSSFATVDGPAGSGVSRYRIFYQAWPEGGEVELSVDGEATGRIDTHAEAAEDRVHEIEVDDGAHELEVRAGEPESARMYGVVMERDGPGVVVDGLALIGAFARVLLKWDEAHWQEQLREREPDLMIFWLGGNDTVSSSVPFIYDQFVKDYGEVVRRAKKARPEASCLVMSVMDAAEERNGRWRTRSQVPRAVEAGKEVARNEGCGFFNTFEAVGGHNTMVRWFRASPRLAASDRRHMTRAGARVVGSLLYKALLEDYDDFLAAGR